MSMRRVFVLNLPRVSNLGSSIVHIVFYWVIGGESYFNSKANDLVTKTDRKHLRTTNRKKNPWRKFNIETIIIAITSPILWVGGLLLVFTACHNAQTFLPALPRCSAVIALPPAITRPNYGHFRRIVHIREIVISFFSPYTFFQYTPVDFFNPICHFIVLISYNISKCSWVFWYSLLISLGIDLIWRIKIYGHTLFPKNYTCINIYRYKYIIIMFIL